MVEPIHQSKGRMWFAIVFLLIAFLLAVFFLSRNNPPLPTATQQSRRYVVTYDAGVFSPTNLRVQRGDVVTFFNASDHVLSMDFVGLEEKSIPAGERGEIILSTPGQVSYFNTSNESEQGTIIVK